MQDYETRVMGRNGNPHKMTDGLAQRQVAARQFRIEVEVKDREAVSAPVFGVPQGLILSHLPRLVP